MSAFLTGFNAAMRASETFRRQKVAVPAKTYLEQKREVRAREEFEREKVVINHSATHREIRFNGHSVHVNPQQEVKICAE